MVDVLKEHPGLLFVAATLLPLASFVVLLLAGGFRAALRPHKHQGLPGVLFEMLGGEVTGRGPAYVALGAIALAFACSLAGFVWFLGENEVNKEELESIEIQLQGREDAYVHSRGEKQANLLAEIKNLYEKRESIEGRWSGSVVWASVQPAEKEKKVRNEAFEKLKPILKLDGRSGVLRVGYRIDTLAAVMFVMVTFVAALIHLFSIGYMGDELQPVVEDHEVHTGHGHLQRRGRFGQFFLYLSLFCFSMLNLVLADNLFQVFVSWELVGICSYLLIGFYFERTSASNAANKAFITNRIGDAGFVIGLLIIWTYIGTFNFQEIFATVRCPEHAAHGPAGGIKEAHLIVTADVTEKENNGAWLEVKTEGETGSYAVLFPRYQGHLNFPPHRAYDNPSLQQHGYMPYWMLVAAGLGIFMGCVGKSAQFPLQVWLPDAMEGPTPVSALIHAATMVAAGVYLVGRCYPLFTPEVLLTIAYTGAITLFVAATIALVMTDIKKVLAYSTVSQLGYMMLGLGVGGWVAGLFHLVTHAFFKALLFLGSGSVILGCHHQQDMQKMGGLYPKMKITALTMLVGCLAIAGIPLFSGWYSKDAILASALGFASVHNEHFLLFLLPVLTAGLTTFYMFRMWFMTFTGQPRDHHVHEHAHESPWVITVPLAALAFFSVTVAWGWPIWDPEKSWLESQLHHAQPQSVVADFGGGKDAHEHHEHAAHAQDMHPGQGEFVGHKDDDDHQHGKAEERHAPAHKVTVLGQAHAGHFLAGNLALALVALGLAFAFMVYYFGVLDPNDAKEQFAGVHNFLTHKWYFDELYSAILVRPGLIVAGWARSFDLNVIDGIVHLFARFWVWVSWVGGLADKYVIDGLANLIAAVSYGIGGWLRGFQTGYLRSYVLFLVLAAVGIWVVLFFLLVPATGSVP